MNLRFIAIIFCFGFIGYCQSGKLKRANKLFLERSYIEAASIFEKVAKNKETFIKLADCYYYNGIMKKASATYKRASKKNGDIFSEDVNFRFAQSLYGVGDISTADSIMSILKSKSINTNHLISRLKVGVPFIYKTKKIGLGGRSGDFGMNYFGDKVIFASPRENSSKNYSWNNQPYLDLYEGVLFEENSIINISPLEKPINSKTHESSAILSNDGKTMYFSRTNEKRHKINDQKIASVKIYKSTYNNDSWSKPTALPFCSNDYSTQHPALDEKNQRLYFSSDMPNGYGSFDIYYVDINEDNSFGEPVNLGPSINSKFREQFPFYSKERILYFASDGLQGLGGLDIFMVEENENSWYTPLNLGETINTEKDDFSYVVDPNKNTGFFSSNREGNDNIYVFKREENLRTFIVEGLVIDKNSRELLPGTKITLFAENGTVIDSMRIGDNSRYVFRVRPETKYKVEGFKPLYIPKLVDFNTDDSGRIEIDIELELESYDDAEDIITQKDDGYVYVELENIYFDLDKWDIKAQAANTLNVLVDLMKKYPRMEIELGAHTDNRSSEAYNLQLSKNRAQSAIAYLIANGIDKQRLKAIGYGESQLLVDCGKDCTEFEHAVNRRCEFIITQ